MAKKEKHKFKAEVKQLLDIVVHSIYTDKEIFLRELISNASDSLEKLRIVQLQEEDKDKIFDKDLPLEININADETAKQITISDYGVGMTREELNDNLGSIAHSGIKKFLETWRKDSEDKSIGENLIGKFGVGFYSVFMVADEVSVFTHSYQKDGGHLCWRSDGGGAYSIEESQGQRRGVKIVIKLKKDAEEFANKSRLQSVIEKHSAFAPFPIILNGERVNSVEAVWLKNKNELKEEDYKKFYQFQAKAFDEPLFSFHFQADAPIDIKALLFTPSMNMESLGMGQTQPSVALHCRKICIDQHPRKLLPEWLRFLKGVVDSADLPLSLSREAMQDSALLAKINNVLAKRVIRFFEKQAKSEKEKYQNFYKSFSRFVKEGVVADHERREDIAKLLLFESSMTDEKELTNLEEYVARMKEGQDAIYYLINPHGKNAAENSPYMEDFKSKGVEVIYFTDTIDEYVLNALGEFKGKKLVSGDRSDVDLGKIEGVEASKKKAVLSTKQLEDLRKRLKEILGDDVEDVIESKRLSESPALILSKGEGASPRLLEAMRSSGQSDEAASFMRPKVILEINPRHKIYATLIKILQDKKQENLGKLIVRQIFNAAQLAAGFKAHKELPKEMLDFVNEMTK